LAIREPIESVLYPAPEHRPYLPEPESWVMAADLITILEPFYDATTVLSGTKYATASVVFPVYKRLLEFINEQLSAYDAGTPIHHLLTSFRADLKELLHECGDKAKIASILDPRFLTMWRSELIVDMERKHLLHEIRKDMKREQEKADKAAQSSEKKEENKEENKEEKKEEKVKAKKSFKLFPAAEDELSRYMREEALDIKGDPLNHWHLQLSRKYPVLARVARRYFSVMASSVASERLFSNAGQVIDDHRASLDPELAEQQVFLLHNKVYCGLTKQ